MPPMTKGPTTDGEQIGSHCVSACARVCVDVLKIFDGNSGMSTVIAFGW